MSTYQPKHIRCFCHGAIALSPAHVSPWEDVWLRWKTRPGRVVDVGLCLLTRQELQGDIALTRQCQETYPDLDYREDLAQDCRLLAALAETRYVWSNLDFPCVYTTAPGIDRAEAERMLRWYLGTGHGLTAVKLCWEKPTHVALPLGMGALFNVPQETTP